MSVTLKQRYPEAVQYIIGLEEPADQYVALEFFQRMPLPDLKDDMFRAFVEELHEVASTSHWTLDMDVLFNFEYTPYNAPRFNKFFSTLLEELGVSFPQCDRCLDYITDEDNNSDDGPCSVCNSHYYICLRCKSTLKPLACKDCTDPTIPVPKKLAFVDLGLRPKCHYKAGCDKAINEETESCDEHRCSYKGEGSTIYNPLYRYVQKTDCFPFEWQSGDVFSLATLFRHAKSFSSKDAVYRFAETSSTFTSVYLHANCLPHSGCAHPHEPGQSYCKIHACPLGVFEPCTNPRMSPLNDTVCDKHICEVSHCPKAALPKFKYCLLDKCKVDDCDERRSEPGVACEKHEKSVCNDMYTWNDIVGYCQKPAGKDGRCSDHEAKCEKCNQKGKIFPFINRLGKTQALCVARCIAHAACEKCLKPASPEKNLQLCDVCGCDTKTCDEPKQKGSPYCKYCKCNYSGGAITNFGPCHELSELATRVYKTTKNRVFSACLEHRCKKTNPSCHSAVEKGYQFCRAHHCNADGCTAETYRFSSQCFEHCCRVNDDPKDKCCNERLSGFPRCKGHMCPGETETGERCLARPEVSGGACPIHQCRLCGAASKRPITKGFCGGKTCKGMNIEVLSQWD